MEGIGMSYKKECNVINDDILRNMKDVEKDDLKDTEGQGISEDDLMTITKKIKNKKLLTYIPKKRG